MSAPQGEPLRTEEVSNFFDLEAARYDREYEAATPGGRVMRARLARTVALLGPGPGEALDVGMGAGRLPVELARRDWTVSGIDGSEAMVKLARERLPERAQALVRADAAALPFSDATFDAVAATGVLEYLDDVGAGLREVVRVLKPGGRAVLSFPSYGSLLLLFQHALWYPAARTAKRIVPSARSAPIKRAFRPRAAAFVRLVAEAGLEVESVVRFGARPLPESLAERIDARQGWLAASVCSQMLVGAKKTRSR